MFSCYTKLYRALLFSKLYATPFCRKVSTLNIETYCLVKEALNKLGQLCLSGLRGKIFISRISLVNVTSIVKLIGGKCNKTCCFPYLRGKPKLLHAKLFRYLTYEKRKIAYASSYCDRE